MGIELTEKLFKVACDYGLEGSVLLAFEDNQVRLRLS
jgi:hypothetical protein